MEHSDINMIAQDMVCIAERADGKGKVEGYYFCLHHNDGRKHLHHLIIPLEADLSRGTPLDQIQVEVVPGSVTLKAQEPRVMTLGEVQKISTENLDGFVWLESRMHSDPDNGDCDIWFSGWANPVEACETDIHIYAFGNEVPVEAKKRMYGITWRCWTSKPTDEQRKAVKWE